MCGRFVSDTANNDAGNVSDKNANTSANNTQYSKRSDKNANTGTNNTQHSNRSDKNANTNADHTEHSNAFDSNNNATLDDRAETTWNRDEPSRTSSCCGHNSGETDSAAGTGTERNAKTRLATRRSSAGAGKADTGGKAGAGSTDTHGAAGAGKAGPGRSAGTRKADTDGTAGAAPSSLHSGQRKEDLPITVNAVAIGSQPGN